MVLDHLLQALQQLSDESDSLLSQNVGWMIVRATANDILIWLHHTVQIFAYTSVG